MATAVRNDPPPVETPPATYTLTLSEHEADVLADLLGNHVVGPHSGPRGVTSGIYSALYMAGAAAVTGRTYFEAGTVKGRWA